MFYPHTQEPAAVEPATTTPEPERPHVEPKPGRVELAVGITPISMLVRGPQLVITDATGAVYVLPADGSAEKPKKLSDQHGVGFAYHAFEAGGEVLATAHQGLFRVALPDGPVTKLAVHGLPESPESAIGDDQYAYVSVFRHDDVMRVPAHGGDAQRLASMKNSVLGTNGKTIFAASYTTGELFALGTAKPIAKGLARPTAVTADATAAYLYCEGDETVRRVELATGTITTLAEHLVNSKELHLDGPWIYTRAWGQGGDRLVRIAKDGKRPMQVIADDLAEPQAIVVTPDAVFVGNKGRKTIVRFDKARLEK